VVKRMKRGSVIVDLAASETGGNVEGTVVDEEILTDNGVRIIGISSLERNKATHATQMFSSNIGNFLEHFWDKEEKGFKFDLEDEILKGCVLTHGGEVVHKRFIKTD
jgi:NAD(P) transhydrogenase subunit alpha